MSHKMYRVCLLMVAIAATTGGILYYCMSQKDDVKQKGTLVKQMQQTGTKVKKVGKNVMGEVANAFEQTGAEVKNAAKNSSRELKQAAAEAGQKIKETAAVTGRKMKEAATVTGYEVKEAAAASGCEWKNTVKNVGNQIKQGLSKDQDA